MEYDSKADTLLHIKRVAQLLTEASVELIRRANVHDNSKLESPEKELFDKYTPILKDLVFGSEEYAQSLANLKPALDHHYENNTHHPQYYDKWHCKVCKKDKKESDTWLSKVTTEEIRFCNSCSGGFAIYETAFEKEDFIPGINGMNLFDILEMFMDWKAAGERNTDGNIYKSIEINKDRFQISEQLCKIFENTAKNLNW